MVRLIHQMFIFNLLIQWKSDIERDTIVELSYYDLFIRRFLFNFLTHCESNIARDTVLELNYRVTLIHQPFNFQSSDSVEI
jgi:hypothetical protein